MDRKNQQQSGQSLVEFAIFLPVLFIMIMLIFDLGRIVYFYSAIHNAAREGARYGSIYGQQDAGQIQAHARTLLAGLDQGSGTLTIFGPCLLADNDVIKLKIEYEFKPVTFILGWLTDKGSFTLQTQSTMQLEYNREADAGSCGDY